MAWIRFQLVGPLQPEHTPRASMDVVPEEQKAIQSLCTAAKGVAGVLEEWIRNVPLALVERIVADTRIQSTPIWLLASMEQMRRCRETPQAA